MTHISDALYNFQGNGKSALYDAHKYASENIALTGDVLLFLISDGEDNLSVTTEHDFYARCTENCRKGWTQFFVGILESVAQFQLLKHKDVSIVNAGLDIGKLRKVFFPQKLWVDTSLPESCPGPPELSRNTTFFFPQ